MHEINVTVYIGKASLGHAVKAYRASRGIAPPDLNLDTKRTSPPGRFTPRTRTAVTTEEEAG